MICSSVLLMPSSNSTDPRNSGEKIILQWYHLPGRVRCPASQLPHCIPTHLIWFVGDKILHAISLSQTSFPLKTCLFHKSLILLTWRLASFPLSISHEYCVYPQQPNLGDILKNTCIGFHFLETWKTLVVEFRGKSTILNYRAIIHMHTSPVILNTVLRAKNS